MDDRSWTDSSALLLVLRVVAWQRWSVSMGLKKNAAKTQLSAWTAKKREQLEQIASSFGMGAAVTAEIEVLGVGWGDRTKKKDKEARDGKADSAGPQSNTGRPQVQTWASKSTIRIAGHIRMAVQTTEPR